MRLVPLCVNYFQNVVTGTKTWSRQVMIAPLCALFDNDDDNFTVKVKVLKGLVTGTTHHG